MKRQHKYETNVNVVHLYFLAPPQKQYIAYCTEKQSQN